MKDYIKEIDDLENDNQQYFNSIEEVSLKKSFDKIKKEISNFFNSKTWKSLSKDLRIKFTNLFKGGVESLKKELELNKDEMSSEQYSELKKVIDNIEKYEEREKESSNNSEGEKDTFIGLSQQKDGSYVIGKNNLIYKLVVVAGSEKARTFNWANSGLAWLVNAEFIANELVIDFKKETVINFRGKWISGEFKGGKFSSIKTGESTFVSGKFNGRMYAAPNESFNAHPTDFINGLFAFSNEGVLGLKDIRVGQQNESFFITQVKPGYVVKLISEDGLTYPFKVIKRMDDKNSNFIVQLLFEKGAESKYLIPWPTIRENWLQFNIQKGKDFLLIGQNGKSILNVKNIKDVFVSSDYEPEKELKKEPDVFKINKNDFNIDEFTSLLSKYNVNDIKINIPSENADARSFFKELKHDISLGKSKLESSLITIKKTIQPEEELENVELKSYPKKYKWLELVFQGTDIEPRYKNNYLDNDEKWALSYLNDFLRFVYKNIVSKEIKKALLLSLRSYIGLGKLIKKKKDTKPTDKKSKDDMKKDIKTKFMAKENNLKNN